MNISNPFKNFDTIEYALLATFIIYLILPIPMPSFLGSIIDTSIGYILLFVVAIFLFFHSNYILAIMFIVVAYELLRRSAKSTSRPISHIPIPETRVKRDKQVRFSETNYTNVDDKKLAFEEIPSRLKSTEMTGHFPSQMTLEESVVSTAKNNLGIFDFSGVGIANSSFKPVYDKADGAASYM
jgi:hypothetical protein